MYSVNYLQKHRSYFHIYLIVILWYTERMFALWILIAYWNITVDSMCEKKQTQSDDIFEIIFWHHTVSHPAAQQQVKTSRDWEHEGFSRILGSSRFWFKYHRFISMASGNCHGITVSQFMFWVQNILYRDLLWQVFVFFISIWVLIHAALLASACFYIHLLATINDQTIQYGE